MGGKKGKMEGKKCRGKSKKEGRKREKKGSGKDGEKGVVLGGGFLVRLWPGRG